MTDDGRVEIRIGGVGGQGIALSGTLLGRAAALYDGKEAVFTQSYGPEARGGASRADVIISDTAISYPFVRRPNVLIAFFQEAYEKFRPDLCSRGLLLVEGSLVTLHADDAGAIKVPAVETATELGNKLAANLVVLGYLIGATGVVSRQAMEYAIRETVGGGHLDLDLQAFGAGVDLAAGARSE